MRSWGVLALASLLAACDGPDIPDRGVLSVELRMTPERLGDLQASTTSGAEIPAEALIDGHRFLVTVEAAGASTILNFKRTLNLRLQDSAFRGITFYRLAATVDPSMLRTPLAFGVFARQGAPVPEVTPVALTVNERYWGLYYLLEKIDEDFLARRGLRCHGLYMTKGGASFAPGMSAELGRYFDAKTKPENLAEIARLAELVESASDRRFAEEIFLHVSRADVIRYLAAAVLTDHWDGFNKNLFYYSTAAGEPLGLIPWDMDKTWYDRVGDTGRVWRDNLLFERIYAIESVRLEVVLRVERALAVDESAARFSERLAALCDRIARAYTGDPSLGGMRGLVLGDQAATLERNQADWVRALQEDGGEGDILGGR